MANKHDIQITNFQPSETVCYPILVIKGLIVNAIDPCQASEISIDGTPFPVVDNKFKALIELTPGDNNIRLNYCCTTTEFSFKFSPRTTKFTVLPLYIICKNHDGTFQAPETETNGIDSALKRLTLGSKLLQSVFAEKLYEENYPRKTFQLESNCRVFHSDLDYLEARKMTQMELWTTLGNEIVESNLDHERIKVLGFLSCTQYCGESYQENYTHDDLVTMTQAYVALGGGNLALFGTACLYTWPEDLSQVVSKFEDTTPVDKTRFMDDSCYRGTLGACFSTTLGSVLHELCHTFDLGHTESGIMGRGFDDVYRIFISEKTNQGGIFERKERSIQFEEEFEKKLLCEKLAQRRKGHKMKNEMKKEKDGTFWTKSCLIFLAYHKWFNDFKTGESTITFDSGTKFVGSRSGLRVIEVRDENDGMVVANWTFEGRVLRYSFQLPEDVKNGVVFIEDNGGNILKVMQPT